MIYTNTLRVAHISETWELSFTYERWSHLYYTPKKQGRRKVWKSVGGGSNSNVVGIICPWSIGLTDLQTQPPCPHGSYSPEKKCGKEVNTK